MAQLKVDFMSKSLMRTVSINVILPIDKVFLGKEEEFKPFKTLYLLHGIFGNNSDWISGTRIESWAKEKNIAVVMPSGENKFYINNEYTCERFSDFIGEELVDMTRKMFHLSNRREDTFIAGLSMGGYGAIINGLKFNNTFGCVAGLSSALILDDVLSGDEGISAIMGGRQYYTGIFGALSKLRGSDKDYEALAKELSNSKDSPRIYLCCGTEDHLINANRRFRDLLLENNFDVTYVEGPGEHNWYFWDEYILKVLEWLPLKEGSKGIDSGNVGI
ncbi:S-formylglutathione hydrolase [uncultured Clostridium sp.]|uniref:alpha/beta hydrolase n=1 Tax=uncultured Clostridium sp. TaxID=59620 RepID=UPI00082293BA|nr:alpha/beta hydrolase-fold protein [uncultured Clostridium sp.]SCK02137.1 S-formylglutathione hydrolase [uncultured Clostridium sp.]